MKRTIASFAAFAALAGFSLPAAAQTDGGAPAGTGAAQGFQPSPAAGANQPGRAQGGFRSGGALSPGSGQAARTRPGQPLGPLPRDTSGFGAAGTGTPEIFAYPHGGGGGGGFASTAEEGLARGVSALIRSAGEADLLSSQAAKNYEEARAMNLDNRLRATTTWFDLRRINAMNRFAGEGPTEEQLFRINQSRLPARLGPAQLDPVTGRIEWPVMLAQDHFAAERGLVEEAFATRATRGSYASPDQYLQMRQGLEQMKTLLARDIDTAPSADYLAARNFLESLDYEAQASAQ